MVGRPFRLGARDRRLLDDQRPRGACRLLGDRGPLGRWRRLCARRQVQRCYGLRQWGDPIEGRGVRLAWLPRRRPARSFRFRLDHRVRRDEDDGPLHHARRCRMFHPRELIISGNGIGRRGLGGGIRSHQLVVPALVLARRDRLVVGLGGEGMRPRRCDRWPLRAAIEHSLAGRLICRHRLHRDDPGRSAVASSRPVRPRGHRNRCQQGTAVSAREATRSSRRLALGTDDRLRRHRHPRFADRHLAPGLTGCHLRRRWTSPPDGGPGMPRLGHGPGPDRRA